jgi:cytochrome P450 monooxygenase-1
MEGFEAGTNETHLMKLIARHQLTHQLTKVTGAVSNECEAALRDIYTDEKGKQDQACKNIAFP